MHTFVFHVGKDCSRVLRTPPLHLGMLMFEELIDFLHTVVHNVFSK